MSIFTINKPKDTVSDSDWHHRLNELKGACNAIRTNAFQVKYDSCRIRDETAVTTHCSTRRTEDAFANRCVEITRWRSLIQSLYEDVKKELECVQDEKKLTEETIELLDFSFKITNHCSTMRDYRSDADYCYDAVTVELRNEQLKLEELKNTLMQVCQAAWEQINRLQELRTNVAEDLDNKMNTLCIDTKLMDMTKHSANIHLRDPASVAKDCCTYEKWLQLCHNLKLCIQGELACSKKFRETMDQPRNQTRNYLRSQADKINYCLRRRIYETSRIKYEIEWNKLNMEEDRDSFREEIEKLENALDSKLSSKKLVETRYGERLGRTGPELCTDQTESGLDEERVQLDNTIRILTDKLEHSKGVYSVIVGQISTVVEELQQKVHTLEVDRNVLEYRKQLDQRQLV